SQLTNAAVTSTAVAISAMPLSRSRTLMYRGRSTATVARRSCLFPTRSAAPVAETSVSAASAFAHQPATRASTAAATSSHAGAVISLVAPSSPARPSATASAARTWRHAPRARRGRNRAGAGCRGRRAARARPGWSAQPGSPARQRPTGTAPRHRAGSGRGRSRCGRRPCAAGAARTWGTRARPSAPARPSSARAGRSWPARPRAGWRARPAGGSAGDPARTGRPRPAPSRRPRCPPRWRYRYSSGPLAALPPRRPGPLATPVELMGLRLGVVPLVGVDDLADQPVPDDVVAGQPGKVDVLDAVQDVLHHAQPADLAGRQVDLGHVAGHHHPRAEAEPGEKHLHLLGRG